MKQTIVGIFMLGLGFTSHAQTIEYGYDAAGNRVLRQVKTFLMPLTDTPDPASVLKGHVWVMSNFQI